MLHFCRSGLHLVPSHGVRHLDSERGPVTVGDAGRDAEPRGSNVDCDWGPASSRLPVGPRSRRGLVEAGGIPLSVRSPGPAGRWEQVCAPARRPQRPSSAAQPGFESAELSASGDGEAPTRGTRPHGHSPALDSPAGPVCAALSPRRTGYPRRSFCTWSNSPRPPRGTRGFAGNSRVRVDRPGVETVRASDVVFVLDAHQMRSLGVSSWSSSCSASGRNEVALASPFPQSLRACPSPPATPPSPGDRAPRAQTASPRARLGGCDHTPRQPRGSLAVSLCQGSGGHLPRSPTTTGQHQLRGWGLRRQAEAFTP